MHAFRSYVFRDIVCQNLRRSVQAALCFAENLGDIFQTHGRYRHIVPSPGIGPHCDLQPWAPAVRTLPAVPRSTQPSTLRGTVNEYQLSG